MSTTNSFIVNSLNPHLIAFASAAIEIQASPCPHTQHPSHQLGDRQARHQFHRAGSTNNPIPTPDHKQPSSQQGQFFATAVVSLSQQSGTTGAELAHPGQCTSVILTHWCSKQPALLTVNNTPPGIRGQGVPGQQQSPIPLLQSSVETLIHPIDHQRKSKDTKPSIPPPTTECHLDQCNACTQSNLRLSVVACCPQ